MNTLQLYISKSGETTARLAEINPSEDGRRAATDVKSAVALIDYPTSAKIVFFIVVSHNEGYAIHVVRTIPPTRPNHLDATIFIDKRLDVMTEDLETVLDRVSKIVLSKAVTEADMTELRQLFAREYDLRDKTPRIKPSRGRDFACLSYGEDSGRTLSDIISDGIYIPEWSDYKGVILLEDSLSPFPNSVVDLDYADEDEEDVEPEDDEPADDYREEPHHAKASKSYNYVFSLPIVTPDGRSAFEFELESSKPISKSPIAGYELTGKPVEGSEKTNRLRLFRGKTFLQRMERWIWGGAGLFVGIIIMSIVNMCSGGESTSTPQQNKVSYETANSNVNATTTDNSVAVAQPSTATAYLDNNRIWNRDDMEKIEGLSGLFDDLNNFRFEEITGKWANQLGASKNFGKVVAAAQKAVSKKSDPRRDDDHNPCYNREGDNAISWLGYTYWIDP